MNTRLLRKVQKHIMKEPKRVYMPRWILEGVEQIKGVKLKRVPACGTVACIGGWAELLTGQRDASKALGIDEEDCDESTRLFYVSNWPVRFSDRLTKCNPQTKAYAKVVSDRIDHFIATKGAE